MPDLSLIPPYRNALQSPLPRRWGSLNSPTSLHNVITPHRDFDRAQGHLDSASTRSPVSSSRPETPTLIPRWGSRSGRHGSGAGVSGGVHSTHIDSWGSGGVMLENGNVMAKSPDLPGISPRTKGGEEYNPSIFSGSGVDSREGSRVGSPRSPSLRELHRKKGSVKSLMRMQSLRSNKNENERREEEAPMRIKSQKSLEKEGQRRESCYRPPTVENVEEDAFSFTGVCTPEPPPMAGSLGETVHINARSRSSSQEGELRNFIRGRSQEEKEESRRPSTIREDDHVPDCYTPTPEPKGPKAKPLMLEPDDDDLDGTTAATKSANGKELESVTSKTAVSPSAAVNPSTLLRLKYPSTHHATIEIQHREGIRITTSGRGGSGNSSGGGGSRISIQVDTDSGLGYTSTIRTGGKRGAMCVTVRPSSGAKLEAGLTTAAITPSSRHKDKEGNESAEEEDGEEELIVATPPNASKKSRTKSHHHHHHHRHSQSNVKSEKHRSITPTRRQPSINLIELSGGSGGRGRGGAEEGFTPPASPDRSTLSPSPIKTVRKMEKSDDLKRESATGSRVQSALIHEAHSYSGPQGWSILDRPNSYQKRTSGAPYHHPMTPIPMNRQNIQIPDQGEGAQTFLFDEDQEMEPARPDSPTLGQEAKGKKPRPLSNSNVPVEVALTMGFRGVAGAGAGGVLEEPPIPGMVPVLDKGSMGMEEMAGGWI